MRNTWIILAVIALFAFVVAPARHAARASAQKKSAQRAPIDSVSWDVEGYGRNQEDAEADALKKTQAKIKEHLEKQKLAWNFAPDAEHIRKHFVASPPKRLEDRDLELDTNDGPIKTLCYSLPIRIDSSQFHTLTLMAQEALERHLKLERDAHLEARLFILGKVLAGLLVILTAIYGYLRLEDSTRGAYTILLRLGAAGVVAVAGLILLRWA